MSGKRSSRNKKGGDGSNVPNFVFKLGDNTSGFGSAPSSPSGSFSFSNPTSPATSNFATLQRVQSEINPKPEASPLRRTTSEIAMSSNTFNFNAAPLQKQNSSNSLSSLNSFSAPAASTAFSIAGSPANTSNSSAFSFTPPNANAPNANAPASAFSFGTSPAATTTTTATPTPAFAFGTPPATNTSTPAASAFAFGTPPATNTSTPAAPAFSFGTPPTTNTTTPTASAFSFGTSPATTTTASAANKPAFSFGTTPTTSTAATSTAATTSTPASAFSFGNTTTPAASTTTTSASTPSFSFGTTPATSTTTTTSKPAAFGTSTATSTSSTSFSFGTTTTTSTATTTTSTPASAAPIFSFGTDNKSGDTKKPADTKFSFGGGGDKKDDKPTVTSSPFTFGTSTTTAASTSTTTTTPAVVAPAKPNQFSFVKVLEDLEKAATSQAPSQFQATLIGPALIQQSVHHTSFRIDNIMPTTRFTELPEQAQKELDELEKYIRLENQRNEYIKSHKIPQYFDTITQSKKSIDTVTQELDALSNTLKCTKESIEFLYDTVKEQLRHANDGTTVLEACKHPGNNARWLFGYTKDDDYFLQLSKQLGSRLEEYKRCIWEIERTAESWTQNKKQSPQDIANIMRTQNEAFMALSNKVAALHESVNVEKNHFSQYLRMYN